MSSSSSANANSNGSPSGNVLDAYSMDRYSRQIGAYGVEAMGKLIKLRVLVCGMKGVGIETAKNLILAGPGAVNVWDNDIVKINDLGSNFFLTQEDVGKKTLAQASASKLSELNRLVQVEAVLGELTEDIIKTYHFVVCTKMSHANASKWNAICRKHEIGFIHSEVYGAMGFSFIDFGEQFSVLDKNGEQPIRRIVADITNEKEAIVHLLPPPDGKRHQLEDEPHEGWITFDEVEGMVEINKTEPIRAHHVFIDRKNPKTGKIEKVFDPYSLRLELDTTKFGKYTIGGVMTQSKKPINMKFDPLSISKDCPVPNGEYSLMFTDGMKFGRAEQLHIGLCGLWNFQLEHKRLPKPNNPAEIQSVLQYTKYHNQAMKAATGPSEDAENPKPNPLFVEQIDESIVRIMGQYASLELQPLCAFFGGIVAQEVVKFIGKFTPLHQWLHVDAFEILPGIDVAASFEPSETNIARTATIHPLPAPKESDILPRNSRYDDLIQMIGYPAVNRLQNGKTFVVGCGALGCELLKNFALLGFACGKDGLITVTDNDTVEVSNLARQFLFREHNVNHYKSVAAADTVKLMNPDLKINSMQTFVAPHTESVFNAKFWESQDFVTNALDNVKARVYVDKQCVVYGKPLFESGTLGTKCNVQVVLPHLTQSYSDGPKDGDGGEEIPMCTLRNFPSQIEHCIEWARARFTDQFSSSVQETSNFLKNPQQWIDSLILKTLKIDNSGKQASAIKTELGPLKGVVSLIRVIQDKKINTFEQCIKDSYDTFHQVYRDKIESLIKSFPADAKDSNGKLFWSGPKRFPQSASFDMHNPIHMGYIISSANLLAVNRGLQPSDKKIEEKHEWRSPDYFMGVLSKLKPPEVSVEDVDMSGGGEEEDKSKKSSEVNLDEQIKNTKIEFEGLLNELQKSLSSLSGLLASKSISVEPCEFEKDADWNFHIDFITAASNLRAWNYRLKLADRHEVKMIAGRIIPALATTTAAVTGLVMIEILKLIQGNKKLSAFKDSSNSLGVNAYLFSEPNPPAKSKDEHDYILMEDIKCKPPGFTKWDKTEISVGNVTVEKFLEEFKKVTGLTCSCILHDNANRVNAKGNSKFIYDSTSVDKELSTLYASRLKMSLKDICSDLYGEDAVRPESQYIILESYQNDDSGQSFKIPSCVYKFA